MFEAHYFAKHAKLDQKACPPTQKILTLNLESDFNCNTAHFLTLRSSYNPGKHVRTILCSSVTLLTSCSLLLLNIKVYILPCHPFGCTIFRAPVTIYCGLHYQSLQQIGGSATMVRFMCSSCRMYTIYCVTDLALCF